MPRATVLPLNSIHPVVVEVNPTTASAGQTVQYYVGLNGTAEAGLAVSIAASPASSFSSIPSTVNVEPGQSGVYFNATLSTQVTQAPTVTASANGQSAQGQVSIAETSVVR